METERPAGVTKITLDRQGLPACRRILVAMDLGPASLPALRRALKLGSDADCEVVVLLVPPRDGVERHWLLEAISPEMQPVEKRQLIQQYLVTQVDRLCAARPPLRVELSVLPDGQLRTLWRAVDALDPDLLILGL